MAGEDVAADAVVDASVDHPQEIDHPQESEAGDGRAPIGARRPGSGLSPIGIAPVSYTHLTLPTTPYV